LLIVFVHQIVLFAKSAFNKYSIFQKLVELASFICEKK